MATRSGIQVLQSMNVMDRYNTRVREENGFALPNPPRDTRSFSTPDEKAHFTTHSLPNLNIPDECYTMMTMRSHDQYNTTIYDVHDRYRGIHGNRRVVLMNALRPNNCVPIFIPIFIRHWH